MNARKPALAPPSHLSRCGDGPNPIDVHVGGRLRTRRTMLGLSQEKLGDAVGITFQQLQKYERGANRISASRLYNLAEVLEVPISFFFDELPPTASRSEEAAPPANALCRRETLEVIRAYARIEQASVRRRACELLKALGAESALAAADD